MRNWYWSLPEELSQHPEFENLKVFLERLMKERGSEIAFVVIFGSAAKGKWTVHSDIDVFIGLNCDDGLRLIDRIGQFAELAQGNLEVFPYERSQWRRMFETFNPLLLDVLEDGIVLFDSGEFSAMRETFQRLLAQGSILRTDSGWRILADSLEGASEACPKKLQADFFHP
ncbi:MAG: nucleotidyltransferase domain-containing protein [Armatimonadetes bacterium]|nr:nucleotidyltransferase domain-containing protein [Armatimonadota bacterium]